MGEILITRTWGDEPRPDKEPRIEPATPALGPKDTFRILIMDSIEHIEQMREACKNAGHSVIAATSIKEAFAFLDGRDHADVIICAAFLQDESVFEFLSRLRNDPVHKDSTFMIMALEPGPVGVRLNASVEIAGRAIGSDAFISMPLFDAEMLIEEIKKLLPLVPKLERSRLEDLEAEAWDDKD